MSFLETRSPHRNLTRVGVGVAAAWWVLEALLHAFLFEDGDLSGKIFTQDRHELWMRSLVAVMFVSFGFYAERVLRASARAEREREALQARLEESLTKILGGFLPICGYCKKIRESGGEPFDRGAWRSIESYLGTRTDLRLSHSVCPDCMRTHFPEPEEDA